MLLRDLASRKRLTAAAVSSYIEAVQGRQVGTAVAVQELSTVTGWTRNARATGVVSESRMYRARIVTPARSYWVTLALWRSDGAIVYSSVLHYSRRPH
jgi:hypothetical protein